jgi:hypothetical protein
MDSPTQSDSSSKPEVFIIESVYLEDEKEPKREGQIISQVLEMSRKNCEYHYIRTKKELRKFLKLFIKSQYRYLHLSCHGDEESLATTFDDVSFKELADFLRGNEHRFRLFLSSCLMASSKGNLAKTIMPATNCISILGPDGTIGFGDAAVFWSSLYHLMFKYDSDGMKGKLLRKAAQSLADIYSLHFNYFGKDSVLPRGFETHVIRPRGEPNRNR